MDDDQQFCLRWNNHQSTLISVIDNLLENGTLVDCTLAAEGQFLKAHKVVLSACSPYFAALLSQQYDKHPIFILKDVKFQELRAMMDYMYRGEVNISQDQLAALLKAAESLQIKGLSDSRSGGSGNSSGNNNGSSASHGKDNSGPAIKHANVPAKGSGLTIEQKRPRTSEKAHATQGEDVSMSREGSVSPTNPRKRKKNRRRSIETNNVDNHDQHSNSSSHSLAHGGATVTTAATQASTMPTITSAVTTSASSLTAAATAASAVATSTNVLNVTKKTDLLKSDIDIAENDEQNHSDGQQQSQQLLQARQNNGGRKSISSRANKELSGAASTAGGRELIEPKNEYDESNEATVEDLTLDDDMMEDMDQAGPSHGGEGSSQGYPQWQIDRSQDSEAFMSGQDPAGQHRDAQDALDDDDDPSSYTVYEVVELEDNGLLLDSENIVVMKKNDNYKLHSWKDLNSRDLRSADVIKKGEVDIIRCAKGVPGPRRFSQHQSVEKRPISAISPTSTTQISPTATAVPTNTKLIVRTDDTVPVDMTNVTIINNGAQAIVKRVIKKHPRIKYSVKHAMTPNQPISHSSIVASSTPNQQKMELLNFALSRKFASARAQRSPSEMDATKAAVGSILPIINQPTPGSGIVPTNVSATNQPIMPITIESGPQTVTKVIAITQEELQTSIISELSNYEIDDIELPDGTKIFTESTIDSIDQSGGATVTTYQSNNDDNDDENDKKMDSSEMQNDFQHSDSNDDSNRNYMCRHCGKKYRWKSTLRRHENVECGGKEPMHQCPHCAYKAKQRGNLGVHIRKHHADLPQLESRRKNRSM